MEHNQIGNSTLEMYLPINGKELTVYYKIKISYSSAVYLKNAEHSSYT